MLRRRLSVALVSAVLATACSSGGDPAAEVAEAVEETFAASFAYDAALEGGSAGLMGGGDQRAMGAGVTARGVRADNGLRAELGILGTPLVEIASLDGGSTSLRLGLDELLGALGQQPDEVEAQALAAVAALGLSGGAEQGAIAAFAGEWVEVTGGLDVGSLLGDNGNGTGTTAVGPDLESVFDSYVIVTGGSGGDYDVDVEMRALAQALADVPAEDTASESDGASPDAAAGDLTAGLGDLPERLPGTVSVRDGVVTDLTLELEALGTSTGTQTGDPGVLRVTLSDHGEVGDIDPPPAEVTLTPEQAAEIFMGIVAGATG